MGISVRLDKETEASLKKAAHALSATKSEVIKRFLKEYCSHILEGKKTSPFNLIKDLLDKEGSGRGDLSIRGEEILREAFRRRQ